MVPPAAPNAAHQLLLGSPRVRLCRNPTVEETCLQKEEKGGTGLTPPLVPCLLPGVRVWWMRQGKEPGALWAGWEEGAEGDIGEAAALGQRHTWQRWHQTQQLPRPLIFTPGD